jgi:hypothetical protein
MPATMGRVVGILRPGTRGVTLAELDAEARDASVISARASSVRSALELEPHAKNVSSRSGRG